MKGLDLILKVAFDLQYRIKPLGMNFSVDSASADVRFNPFFFVNNFSSAIYFFI